MIKLVSYSIKIIISLIIVGIIFIFSALMYFSSGLPDYNKLTDYEPPVSSRVYANNGKLIAEYALEKRLFIPYSSVPDIVINSFLSAEDKNFFNHSGIDAKGILRATLKNFHNIINNKRLEGASTITQQVAKNFLLTNEVSVKRKIKEAILAFRIEKAYTKQRILELYLNQIYLGEGTYGIAAASLEYFDKSVKELGYDEAALLAALPKAPSKYNPFKYPKIAKKRRDFVLDNLFENKFIEKKDFLNLRKRKIILKKRKIELLDEANFYSEEVRRTIKNKYGYKKLYKEGFAIKVPLDVNYQIFAQKALRKGIESYDKRHGWRGSITNRLSNKNWREKVNKLKIDSTLKWNIAEIISLDDDVLSLQILKNKINIIIKKRNYKWATKSKTLLESFEIGDFVFVKQNKIREWELKQYPKVNGSIVVLDPFTGKVKAMVGGFSYKSSEFNRVTQARRQPGSAFKPFVYAAALENGYSPNSIILDAPFIAEQGIGLKNWKPENYGKKFYGPSTLRKGIEYSRNLMTVRISENVGLDKILDLSKNLNIYSDIPELLSVSLGSAETTLLDITAGYASFVNGGRKINPILIDRIQDRRGKTIYNADKRECSGCDRYLDSSSAFPEIKNNYDRVFSKETAYQITSILEGAVQRGTGKKLKDLKVPLAGKTGTTNNNFDAWFIGFSSNLVIGVYVGFDNPKSLGRYETGAKAALPIFKDFVKNAMYLEDFKEFDIPEGIFFAPINYDTGNKENFNKSKAIIEAFKKSNIKKILNNKLEMKNNYDRIIKYRQFY